MKLRYFLIVIAFLGQAYISFAQTTSNDSTTNGQKGEKNGKTEDLQFSFETSFATALGTDAYRSVINPSLKMPVNQRLSLFGGLMLESGNLLTPYDVLPSATGNRTSLTFGGTYDISKRLRLSGYGTMSINQTMTSGENQGYFARNNRKSFGFNMDYQVSKNVNFSAGFEYGNRLDRFNRGGGLLRRTRDPIFRNNGLGTPAQFNY